MGRKVKSKLQVKRPVPSVESETKQLHQMFWQTK